MSTVNTCRENCLIGEHKKWVMNLAVLILLLSVVLVSLNPVWIQLALWGGASPLALTFWQAAFAALLYSLIALKKRSLFVLKWSVMLHLLLVGIAFFTMALCFSLSLERLSASYTVMLFFSYPIYVLVGNAILFKEKLSRAAILSLLTLFMGVVIITWPQGRPESLLGIAFALIAAVAHAIFIISTGRNTKKTSPLQVAIFAQFGFFAASFVLLPFLSVPLLLNAAVLRFGFILAFLSSLLGFILFVKGVAGLGANRASLISVTNLPLSLLFSWLFLGDVPGPRLMVGFIFILAGLLLEAFTSNDKTNTT
jgi:drug/metabolite transporter (DMT)-like permease